MNIKIQVEKELKYKYLTNYLKDGEEILLEIAPNKGFMFHLYDIILIGFTIFALILSILMISASSFDVFSVFPLVFGIIIIWTFSNTFFKRYQNSIHTWYYITNHRIIFRRKYGFLQNKWFSREEEYTFEHKGNN